MIIVMTDTKCLSGSLWRLDWVLSKDSLGSLSKITIATDRLSVKKVYPRNRLLERDSATGTSLNFLLFDERLPSCSQYLVGGHYSSLEHHNVSLKVWDKSHFTSPINTDVPSHGVIHA